MLIHFQGIPKFAPWRRGPKELSIDTDASSANESQQQVLPQKEVPEDDVGKQQQLAIMERRGSFTDVEAFVLHALLIDNYNTDDGGETMAVSDEDDISERRGETETVKANGNANVNAARLSPLSSERSSRQRTKSLNDDILFTVPARLIEQLEAASQSQASHNGSHQQQTHVQTQTQQEDRKIQRPQRRSIVDLWRAHADGVGPRKLAEKGLLHRPPLAKLQENDENNNGKDDDTRTNNNLKLSRSRLSSTQLSQKSAGADEDGDMAGNEEEDDIASDVEVRHENKDDPSVDSSWDEDEHCEHFDAWEVLKDEYASDFGFDYSMASPSLRNGILLDSDDESDLENDFMIIGTSADDASCQPHVLSPPLMDALMTFLPDKLQSENYWLKFSLVRDGASLATLKSYVRAAQYTIIAIETPKGEVFGSFTSDFWRTAPGYYGKPPAFVWKMRHSRQTKCYSLFDQAQLESEIDVFMDTERRNFVQVCQHDCLAVGGDDSVLPIQEDSGHETKFIEDAGFALKLADDLLRGTTSPCNTFRSPALCGMGDKTEFFEVAGLEVWTLTPCRDVSSAEKLEMTKYFIEESTNRRVQQYASESRLDTSSSSSSPRTKRKQQLANKFNSARQFTSNDLLQQDFYRRVGQDPDAEARRQRWQYMNMMNSTEESAARGLGASPRFEYSGN